MAAFDTTRTAYGAPSFFTAFTGHAGGIFAAISAWNDKRITRKALSSLSDRELEDIGLTRGDIDYVADMHFIR